MSGMGDAIRFWLGAFASPFLGFIAFGIVSVLVMVVMSPVMSAEVAQVLKTQLKVAGLGMRSAWGRLVGSEKQ